MTASKSSKHGRLVLYVPERMKVTVGRYRDKYNYSQMFFEALEAKIREDAPLKINTTRRSPDNWMENC